MIESIRLINFQAHADRPIQLGRITTIVGPSDTGKSSIIRALYWIALNRPLGDAFRREGAEEVEVQVYEDNQTVSRFRDKSGNGYRLTGESAATTLKATGTTVPELIAQKLNLTSLNFQSQHDAPFWFAASASEVSRELNAIINLDAIDRTLANLGSMLYRARESLSVTQFHLERAEKEAAQLERVPHLNALLKRAEEADRLASAEAHLAHSLAASIAKSVALFVRSERLRDVKVAARIALEANASVLRADRKRYRLSQTIDQAESYRRRRDVPVPDPPRPFISLIDRREKLAGRITRLKSQIDQAESHRRRKDVAVPDSRPLGAIIPYREVQISQVVRINELITQAVLNGERSDSWYQAAGERRQTLEKESGGLCPLCGNPTGGK